MAIARTMLNMNIFFMFTPSNGLLKSFRIRTPPPTAFDFPPSRSRRDDTLSDRPTYDEAAERGIGQTLITIFSFPYVCG